MSWLESSFRSGARWGAVCFALLNGGCNAMISERPNSGLNKVSPSGGGASAIASGGASAIADIGAAGMPIRPLPTAPAEFGLGPAAMTRLTSAAYLNTLRDIFGGEYARGVATEPDFVVSGLTSIGARSASVSRAGVRLYDTAANSLAERAFGDANFRATWLGCVPTGPADATCAAAFVSKVGRRLFRRPLSVDEVTRYANVILATGASAQDFMVGAKFALVGMLLSPKFNHLVELGVPESGGRLSYTDHELAARLSYTLWNTTPDEPLLSAADTGALVGGNTLTAQTDRLLADEARLADGARDMATDLYALSKVDSVNKDAARFTQDSPTLRASMREATLRLAADTWVAQQAELTSIFESQVAFVDANLAPLYAVGPPAIGFARLVLATESPRIGLLTEPSLLTMLAGPNLTSPTKRGRFIRERILCGTIPDPPPNVDMGIPVTAVGQTRREQGADHMKTPACKGCHSAMDPLGFGLEQFDALGQFQATDNGQPVDASGELDGVPFSDARGLARALRTNPALIDCTVKTLFRHVVGRLEDATEQAAVDSTVAYYAEVNGQLRPLLRRLVLSESFRKAAVAP
ncbi:MAG: DUF1588 domain-containing protein [Polyangiaceae bacterium]|nr:DUF1588 domain-containing protein [Polyangiaceae bacterium]